MYRPSIFEGMVPLPKHMSELENNVADLKEIGFDEV
jgi:hypothetical protein